MVKILVTAALCLCLGSAQAEVKRVKLTSLEWPPYTGQALPEQGATAAVARAAFAAMGYELVIDFYPWSRALLLARKPDSDYVGYFPEYYAESLKADFILSAPIGHGPLGFVERTDDPQPWTQLTDLRHITIGTVQDYINTEEFDRLAAEGTLRVELANDDSANLRKVAGQRLRLAVIDRYVMDYLLEHDAGLADVHDLVQFNARMLEDKQLYICFRKDARGQAMARIFDEGLKRIDPQAIVDRLMKKPVEAKVSP